MNTIRAFLRSNLGTVAAAVITLLVAAVAFPFLMGLTPVVGIGLWAVVVGATVAVYRLTNRASVDWRSSLDPGRISFSAVAGIVLVALVIQAIPYGRDHTNPPVTAEPAWDSARTRELTVRSCFGCHSNEVDWPWYSTIAPMSWAVQSHVEAGRAQVNYSEWDRPQREADESAETVAEGEMPPGYYTLLAHPEARLTDAERSELIAGLRATFGNG